MLKEIRVIVLVRREGAHEYYVTSSSVAEGRRKREKRENTPERRVTFRVKRRGERERGRNAARLVNGFDTRKG